MKFKRITSIDTALYIYYSYPEIGNTQIRSLFGNLSSATLAKYKQAAMRRQLEKEIRTSQYHTVNTEAAYEAWGIDVKDLEVRKKKLKALGFTA